MASHVDENSPRQDDDILTHCAYAFPGVVYTLGKDSWSVLRNTYLTLAENLPHSMVSRWFRTTVNCTVKLTTSLSRIAHSIAGCFICGIIFSLTCVRLLPAHCTKLPMLSVLNRRNKILSTLSITSSTISTLSRLAYSKIYPNS